MPKTFSHRFDMMEMLCCELSDDSLWHHLTNLAELELIYRHPARDIQIHNSEDWRVTVEGDAFVVTVTLETNDESQPDLASEPG